VAVERGSEAVHERGDGGRDDWPDRDLGNEVPVARVEVEDARAGRDERAELLAVPLLLIVLLFVFRSAVAALIPLLFGALTVFAGRGVLVLLAEVMSIDAISLVVCTMMGLALGVDYSLLIVSRFREELAGGRTAYDAAMRSRATAGRTTFFAGATLLAALGLSAFVQPGSLLLSLATTVGVATVLEADPPRIVRGKAITNVAGDPNLRPSDEKALRKEIVNKALKALTTPVKKSTAFD